LLARVVLPLALLFILAGCGGSTSSPAQPGARVVQGAGFRFSVPGGWAIRRQAGQLAAESGKALVSATTFTLLKRYRPALFAKAAAELDRSAAQLAAQAHGKLTEKSTITVSGLKVRAYRYTAGGFDTRIGFVLEGKREVQLLCRAPAGSVDPDGACDLLFGSFTLGAA
jgi:predicted Zn-dependent protease